MPWRQRPVKHGISGSEPALKILFLHQNFPGQFGRLSARLAAAGHEVHALALHERPVPAGVRRHLYRLTAAPGKDTPPLLRDAEAKVLRGQACAQAMRGLAAHGVKPDLIVANPGWGEALFAKDVFPEAKLVCLMEFFHGQPGSDFGFDPEFGQPSTEAHMTLRMKNLALIEALLSMDRGVAPTAWQASRMPEAFASKMRVVFDGIDTDAVQPHAQAVFELPDAAGTLRAGDPVITYVARDLEPYRGFHSVMRALPEVLRRQPQAQVVVVGRDGLSYGAPAPHGATWKAHVLAEVGAALDLSRVHFLGRVPYPSLVKLLQVSAAHVYFTYPFVLSWSCLEALSAGCHVVGSRTAPVQEFITDGVNGSLVDFFDPPALAERLCAILQSPGQDAELRRAARHTAVTRCDWLRVCEPQWRALLSEVMQSEV